MLKFVGEAIPVKKDAPTSRKDAFHSNWIK